jgi:hypothetical protein
MLLLVVYIKFPTSLRFPTQLSQIGHYYYFLSFYRNTMERKLNWTRTVNLDDYLLDIPTIGYTKRTRKIRIGMKSGNNEMVFQLTVSFDEKNILLPIKLLTNTSPSPLATDV